MDKAHLRWLHRGTGVGTARVRYRLTGTNDRFWPVRDLCGADPNGRNPSEAVV
jgi:hypothetical protein